MTYPQQIQLFSNTDGRLDTANVLSLENAFNFFFISPCCVYSFTYVSDCQELLTNRREIHFVSTQLGTLVIQHLLLNISSVFSSWTSKPFLKIVTAKLIGSCQYLEAELSNHCYVYYYRTKLSVASQ